MTLEDVKKSRELAGENVIKVINDNQHIFYYNRKDAPQLIFDDANERCIAFRANQDQYTQDYFPIEVVVFSYDQIQHMMILSPAEDALAILESEGTSLGADEKDIITKFINATAKNYVNPVLRYKKSDTEVKVRKVYADNSIVMVDSKTTLNEAVNSVSNGGTVVLTEDITPTGLMPREGVNFTLDLNGHKILAIEPLAGADFDHECQGMRLPHNTDITIKNGIITTDNVPNAQMVIQNYSNLILDNVTLIGSSNVGYVLSNNFGNTILKNHTKIESTNDRVAFDVWYGNTPLEDDGVTVIIADDTVEIIGKVEYGKKNRADAEKFKTNVKFTIPTGYESKINLTSEGYEWKDNGDGTQTLVAKSV